MNTPMRRTEFADFLQSRRARVRPEDVGLVPGTRRRVSGLRREEVAQLAGVGLTWYTWLEQGRPIAASAQVLQSIARALRMTADEREHLFALADVPPPAAGFASIIQESHLDLIEKLMPYPASIQNARFDLLAYNRAYRFLFGDLNEVPAAERNCVWLLFNNAAWHEAHPQLASVQARIVARLRQRYGRHHDNERWRSFVANLTESSPAFRDEWQRGDVDKGSNPHKKLMLTGHGSVSLRTTSVWLDESLETQIVWFAPEDAASAKALERLVADTRAEPAITTVAA